MGSKFQKPKPDSESASLRYYVHQFSDKTNNFEFLGPNLPKNGFWGRNFKNLSLDSESTPPKYHVCQFLVKIWGNCPITCNILVQILLRVLQRAGWRLKWAGWRWVKLGGGWNELGGGGWSWVEDGARFNNTRRWMVGVWFSNTRFKM